MTPTNRWQKLRKTSTNKLSWRGSKITSKSTKKRGRIELNDKIKKELMPKKPTTRPKSSGLKIT
jgi:hypothetical protein